MKKRYFILSFLLIALTFGQAAWAQAPGNLLGWLVYSRAGTPYGSIWAYDLHNRHVMLADSSQFPKISANGRYMFYTRQNGDMQANHTGTVVRMNLVTGEKKAIFQFNDYLVGYDMFLPDSSSILGYSCGMYSQTYDASATGTIFQVDCFDDAPDLRQRDTMLVYHNANQGIKLFSRSRGSLGVIPGTKPGDYWPQWSPDGQWILFGRAGITNTRDPYRYINNFYKVHEDGTNLTRLTRYAVADTGRFGQNFAWSADGSEFYTAGALTSNSAYSIFSIKADSSGSLTQVLSVPSATISWLHGRPANITAIAPRHQVLPLAISPNPAAGKVNIQMPSQAGGRKDIRILDATGRLVLRMETRASGTVPLPIASLKAGAYLAQVISEKGVAQGKLVVE